MTVNGPDNVSASDIFAEMRGVKGYALPAVSGIAMNIATDM